MRIFGFEIKREGTDLPEITEPVNDDGAVTIGSTYGRSVLNFGDVGADSEGALVTKYRSMVMEPEVSMAVDDVVNDAIHVSENSDVVSLILDKLEYSDEVKEKIAKEFEQILVLLEFSNKAYDIFYRWYVDGRLNYHVIIDEDNVKNGIQKLSYIDPRNIKLVREVEDNVFDSVTGARLKKVKSEYYVYTENGFSSKGTTGTVSGFKIAKDSIVRVTSGIMNENNTTALSHLHKAIKSLNQLRSLEDATIIYTLTRAPERRVFYIDVGNLPQAKAEQMLVNMMTRHKNKLVYDSATGAVADSKQIMTMTEDFWFARREGSNGTQVDTLAGGASLMDNDNLTVFQRKLYKALNVPVTRIDPESQYTLGRSSEISRDEVKFSKFIRRLRDRFSMLFDELLEKQLILRGVITPDEWQNIRNQIRYKFSRDNFFEELKTIEILRERIGTMNDVGEHVGVYFSKKWVRKEILRMTDEEIEEMHEEMEQEKKDEPDEDVDF